MALTDGNNGIDATMLVSPYAGVPAYGGGFGGGMFGGSNDWLGLLFLIALCNGGWGGFGGFGGGYGAMMGMGMMGMDYLYPWLNNSEHISDGFRDQQLSTQVSNIQNAVTSGFGDVQTALCGGFAGVNQNICQTGNNVVNAVTGAQNAIAQQLYGNEIASLERSYAAQTASTAGMNAIQAQLANCCCENRLATADTKYTIATEACANRTAAASNTRDIIDSQTRGTQAILDKLCTLELDNYKRENDQLRTQLNFANLQASQTAQTAAILQGQANEIDGVYNRLKNCPVGTYSVCNPYIYPSQNGNCGCGCGCNG